MEGQSGAVMAPRIGPARVRKVVGRILHSQTGDAQELLSCGHAINVTKGGTHGRKCATCDEVLGRRVARIGREATKTEVSLIDAAMISAGFKVVEVKLQLEEQRQLTLALLRSHPLRPRVGRICRGRYVLDVKHGKRGHAAGVTWRPDVTTVTWTLPEYVKELDETKERGRYTHTLLEWLELPEVV